MRFREKRTTEPTTLAIDLQQVKAMLRISDSDIADDPLVQGLIRAATDACEQYTRRALITQTWTAYLDVWPSQPSEEYWEGMRVGPSTLLYSPAYALELNHPPLQSITSIKTYDDSDVATTYSTDNYFADTSSEPGRIVLRTSAATPITTRAANGVEIIYVSGYGTDAHDIPEALRLGMLNWVAHYYEHRGDVSAQPPGQVRALWDRYRIQRLW